MKELISDEQTLAEMDARNMEEACRLFLNAERRFQTLCDYPDKVTNPEVNVAWWQALETVYELEKIVWRLFVGPQPTLEQNKLYARFRALLLKGSKLEANA